MGFEHWPPGALQREADLRRLRADLIVFGKWVMAREGLAPAPHHLLLLRALASVARGETTRLMVFMPPGSAKSTYASVVFPAWFLTAGKRNVLAASHTASLAESFSRRVRSLARLAPCLGWEPIDERATDWSTTNGGLYRAAGVGGGIAGFRADLGLIDDPLRNRADADSRTVRQRIWDWYRADFLTRLRPRARQVLVMTRWHEDDLAGRLLLAEPDAWRLLKLPAIAEEADPLGRAPGAPLWDDAYGYGQQLLEARRFYEQIGGMRDWNALYQQTPRPAEGALFKVDKMPIVDRFAPTASVRGWDLAATDAAMGTNPDWTAGVRIGRDARGAFAVTDIVRLRGGPDIVEAAIRETADRDGRDVTISLPQDPGQAGKAQLQWLSRGLAGYRIHASTESGSKINRATPFASQCNQANVAVIRAAWTDAFIEELRSFPGGAKDDQVDASSRAFMALADLRPPGHAATLPFMMR